PVNPELRQQATGTSELIDCRPADLLPPELDQLRHTIGDMAGSEEDVLSFAMFPEVSRQFFEERKAGTLKPEPLQPHPCSQMQGQQTSPTEFHLVLHGETFHVKVTGAGQSHDGERNFYLILDGMPEEVLVKNLPNASSGGDNNSVASNTGRPLATREGQVSATIPCKISDVLVKEGDRVQAGQPVLVTEAMKMESEVLATITGRVSGVYVQKGDRVTPEEALIEIEADMTQAGV
ncbi:MAG: pyruvate carboxylase subunit B, partial [Magnetococcales bacterium]|nr:pyruvate carboxylase subunit B [Magnetococcales bacterium]